MLLDNNTKKVIELIGMFDDLKKIDKIRLAIYLLENKNFNINLFSSTYDNNHKYTQKKNMEMIYEFIIGACRGSCGKFGSGINYG